MKRPFRVNLIPIKRLILASVDPYVQNQTVHAWRWSVMRCNLPSPSALGRTPMWQWHFKVSNEIILGVLRQLDSQRLFVLWWLSRRDVLGQGWDGWLCYPCALCETFRSDRLTPVCVSDFFFYSLLFPLPRDVLSGMTFTSRTQGTRSLGIDYQTDNCQWHAVFVYLCTVGD